MRGRKEVVVPDDGVDLILKIKGEEYEICPSVADVLRFQSAVQGLDDITDPGQEAVLVDALLSNLTTPHTEFIRSLSAAQQSFICAEIWDWFSASLPEEESDPTVALSESPKAPESASPMSSNGTPDSSSALSTPSPALTPNKTSDNSLPSAPLKATTPPL